MHLLCATHILAPVGALSAQIPTASSFACTVNAAAVARKQVSTRVWFLASGAKFAINAFPGPTGLTGIVCQIHPVYNPTYVTLYIYPISLKWRGLCHQI